MSSAPTLACAGCAWCVSYANMAHVRLCTTSVTKSPKCAYTCARDPLHPPHLFQQNNHRRHQVISKGGTDRKILGQTVTKEDQLKLSVAITVPMLWFSSAGGAVFWVVGASLCLIGGHAALMPTPEESDPLAGLV